MVHKMFSFYDLQRISQSGIGDLDSHATVVLPGQNLLEGDVDEIAVCCCVSYSGLQYLLEFNSPPSLFWVIPFHH